MTPDKCPSGSGAWCRDCDLSPACGRMSAVEIILRAGMAVYRDPERRKAAERLMLKYGFSAPGEGRGSHGT